MKKPNDIEPSSFCVPHIQGNKSEKYIYVKCSLCPNSYSLLKIKPFPNFFSKFFGVKGEYYLLDTYNKENQYLVCIFTLHTIAYDH